MNFDHIYGRLAWVYGGFFVVYGSYRFARFWAIEERTWPKATWREVVHLYALSLACCAALGLFVAYRWLPKPMSAIDQGVGVFLATAIPAVFGVADALQLAKDPQNPSSRRSDDEM